MDLDLLQQDMADWLRRNFPTTDATQELLGVVEEVGELSHAHLKHLQKVREAAMDDGDAITFQLKVDAVGDIFVFLAQYCSLSGINLRGAIEQTWARVRERDYTVDPMVLDEPIASRRAAHADS